MSDDLRYDVTPHVRGVLQDEEIVLTHNGQPVGRIPLRDIQPYIAAGYHMDDTRIYQIHDPNQQSQRQTAYVEDCDMGWC